MERMTLRDRGIRTALLDKFYWDPAVGTSDLGVQVDDGVVTLTGDVDTCAVKLAAEDDARRMKGVRAVANNLTVRILLTDNDTDIRKSAANALAANRTVPTGAIDVTVQNGKVTLRGEVDRLSQRNSATNTVRNVRSVRDVVNLIHVKQPNVSRDLVASEIKEALVRAAEIDADRIRVQVDGGQVTLSGAVQSLLEKRESECAARRVDGVTHVANNLEVRSV
jgi:osmotically-inducible protein OsmY